MQSLTWAERIDPIIALDTILADGRLAQLLSLVQERDYRFKRKRYGPTDLVSVDVRALVLDWLRGNSLAELVADHLAEVDANR